MFTFKQAAALQKLFLDFYNRGKVSSALCHGTSLLLYLKDANGEPFVKGKTMTGFANSEEDCADQAVGQTLMPFRIEEEASKLGANFIAAPGFQPYALRHGRLITGQQQYSGAEVAKLVIETLEQQRELDGLLSIAFFGAGRVSSTLAHHLARLGHTVSIAAHDPNSQSIKAAQAKNTSLAGRAFEVLEPWWTLLVLQPTLGAAGFGRWCNTRLERMPLHEHGDYDAVIALCHSFPR
jgi:hypothetical protein